MPIILDGTSGETFPTWTTSTRPSWILNNTTWLWEAPTPMPTDGKIYMWNEDIINWKEV